MGLTALQDTAVATQALSAYSLHKQGVREVNLHCSISSSTSVPYSRSFEFNEQNALIPKALSDVSALWSYSARGDALLTITD